MLIVFGGLRFWERRDDVPREVRLTRVIGLESGAQVFLNGIQVGPSTRFALAPEDLGKVDVTIEVEGRHADPRRHPRAAADGRDHRAEGHRSARRFARPRHGCRRAAQIAQGETLARQARDAGADARRSIHAAHGARQHRSSSNLVDDHRSADVRARCPRSWRRRGSRPRTSRRRPRRSTTMIADNRRGDAATDRVDRSIREERARR